MSNKINILFVLNSLYGGGAEKILQTLLKYLNKNKYNITIYGVLHETLNTTLYPKHVTYKTIFNGYSGNLFLKNLIVKIKNKIKLWIYSSLKPSTFYKYFIKGAYDVEVAFIEGYSTKIVSGSNQKSIKIAWVHIDLEANHWTQIAYNNLEEEKQCYKQFNHIVSVSQNVQEAFSEKFGINKNLVVKYNPVDRKDILLKSKESINATKSKSIRIVTVGRLEHQKGYDRLLKVALRLKEESFNFELWILGEGTQHSDLKTYIEENQLEDIVTLLGFQSNPYKYIAVSDIFVCSSRSEGFSTVVTEALILGKPIVATHCSGMKELLGDSQYGLLVENNEEALYQGVKNILSNQELLKHYQSTSETRSEHFDIKITMQEIEKLWN
ncbi:glycosyltransferase [Yeosuana sp. AK3]